MRKHRSLYVAIICQHQIGALPEIGPVSPAKGFSLLSRVYPEPWSRLMGVRRSLDMLAQGRRWLILVVKTDLSSIQITEQRPNPSPLGGWRYHPNACTLRFPRVSLWNHVYSGSIKMHFNKTTHSHQGSTHLYRYTIDSVLPLYSGIQDLLADIFSRAASARGAAK